MKTLRNLHLSFIHTHFPDFGPNSVITVRALILLECILPFRIFIQNMDAENAESDSVTAV